MSLAISLLSHIKNKLLVFKLCEVVITFFQYLNDKLAVGDVIYTPGFNEMIKKYLHCDLQKDWIGRLYGVINPNINSDGKFDLNNVIMEIDGSNTNSDEFVKIWAYRQLKLIGELFQVNRIYDYIDVQFRHVGPITQDNYLIIFDISSRIYLMELIKSCAKQLLYYIIIAAIIYGAITLF